LAVVLGVLAIYVASGLVWATRRKMWRLVAETTLRHVDESDPQFQIVFASSSFIAATLFVALWPYFEWRHRTKEREEADRDADILDIIVTEFRALGVEEQRAILKHCSRALVRALLERFGRL